mgnify:CR=1 FL=1
MKIYCVYVHRKITDGSIFYVGKARGHKRARSKSARSEYWKRVERKHGRTVHIVSEGLSNDEACELEMFLISEIGRDSLVNMTDGGEGTPGRFVSEETREKVRNKNKGVRPAEHTIMSAVKKTRKPVGTVCGMRFESITAAARWVMPESPKTAKINISSCCNGVAGQQKAYGLEFRFIVDGEIYSSNHEKKHVIFNSRGMSFCSPKTAGEWCASNDLASSPAVAAGNIVSALYGRVHSAYGMTWWRIGEPPKEYIRPSLRRARTMGHAQ